jgi:hypothetical protein
MRLILLSFLLLPTVLFSQIEISKQSLKGGFAVADSKNSAGVYFDTTDFEVVRISARLFVSDIERVTGKLPKTVWAKSQLNEYVIIIGTVGKSQWINELVAAKKINVDSIRNQWERYTIQTIENPFPGVKQALVIAGSDRRGTAFGVFTVSEAIGVSPWYWWADVPVQKSASLSIKPISYISKSPTVKYRGIFINDEDWGLFQWAKNTFDPELKNIGPETYEKVYELLLRLKLNYIWPAMHEISAEFASMPNSADGSASVRYMQTGLGMWA